ncbi:MAG: lipid-A-disaccharide synthase [Paludibacteraceae bacterium]
MTNTSVRETTKGKGTHYFLIAGEASGDLHASNLMREIKKLDANAEFYFLGGDLMLAQGGKLIKHYREMAFMGFVNVLKNAPTVLNNLKECKQAIQDFRPDVVILIDYPSFNLRIAKFVKKELQTPVYYYIAPKIWAWKKFRIRQIKKYIDKMFTILPFETEFYKKHNYKVNYVGNPTVDSIAERPNQNQTFEEFCLSNDLINKSIIAVLPGSRKQEIDKCLPIMLEALKDFSTHQIVVSGAPGIPSDYYLRFIKKNDIHVVFNQAYELVAHADAAVVNSGTATLETALIGTPQVVVYHVAFGRIAMVLKKLFIKVKYVSLVNLIADREVVRELLGHHFTQENVKEEVEKLLNDKNYLDNLLEGYQIVKNRLGTPGAAKQAAEGIVSTCK